MAGIPKRAKQTGYHNPDAEHQPERRMDSGEGAWWMVITATPASASAPLGKRSGSTNKNGSKTKPLAANGRTRVWQDAGKGLETCHLESQRCCHSCCSIDHQYSWIDWKFTKTGFG